LHRAAGIRQDAVPVQRAVPIIALLGALVVAAPAAASPALKLDYPCYRSGQNATATVTDFDANTDVEVLLDNNALGTSQTDDQGDFSVDFNAPRLPKGVTHDRSRITAQDQTGLIAEDLFGVVPLSLKVSPARAPAKAKVRFSLGGFVERTSLYEHVLRNGRQVGNILFGTPRAPCGTLTRTVRQLPMKKPKRGVYTLQFDLESSYDRTTSPAVRWTVRVP
jgi:hypothetical protein